VLIALPHLAPHGRSNQLALVLGLVLFGWHTVSLRFTLTLSCWLTISLRLALPLPLAPRRSGASSARRQASAWLENIVMISGMPCVLRGCSPNAGYACIPLLEVLRPDPSLRTRHEGHRDQKLDPVSDLPSYNAKSDY